jgi:xanthine dehydrogenase accessory factor
MAEDILDQAGSLRHAGEPFALATVVRVTRPASARPGAKAIVRADGAISGWVGGSCAQPMVAKEALAALRDGQPRLLCLVGEGGLAPERAEGMVVQPMTCHSGGTLEIYIEPFVPRPRLLIVGRSPVGEALAQLGALLHFEVALVDPDAQPERASAVDTVHTDLGAIEPLLTARTYVIVASHGAHDHAALELALKGEAAYVALVASRRRTEAVAQYLVGAGLPAERLARLRAPAGLDIGAAEPAEVALSIMAEIVQTRRQAEKEIGRSVEPSAVAIESATAIDPVCGMAVEVASARYTAEHEGQRFYFCCPGCKYSFEHDPAQYLVAQ